MIEMSGTGGNGEWVFKPQTKSGHVEKSSMRKHHKKVCNLAEIASFPLYSFRHTCLTRWAAHMDPYTLAYLAGHSDFATTKRYVHPQAHTILEAVERARRTADGHSFGHSDRKPVEGTNAEMTDNRMKREGLDGRGEWIRTTDLLVPNCNGELLLIDRR